MRLYVEIIAGTSIVGRQLGVYCFYVLKSTVLKFPRPASKDLFIGTQFQNTSPKYQQGYLRMTNE